MSVEVAASGKTGMAVAVVTVTSPAWVQFLTSDTGQAIAIGLGILVSLSILAINIRTLASKK